MNILSIIETLLDLPAVQAQLAAAVVDEVKKVVKDAQGQKDLKDFFTAIAAAL